VFTSVAQVLAFLTLLALGSLALLLLIAVGSRISPGIASIWQQLRQALVPSALGLAWLVAVVATLGSLYFSEVARFAPCLLCWYQRIAMYPLVVILGIAATRNDGSVRWYAVPLTVIGGTISFYHVLVERLPALQSPACARDVPCTILWVHEFGFVTIPVMALSAFVLILVFLLGALPSGDGE